ncbi:MBL fold metallo-hydrolase [Christensenellaceae bacterium OttesenSCG-928-K19]|nr:MBL fold metallo-hydrolase [Christensenellaceae bacterium OttesenSCG-928-K19]
MLKKIVFLVIICAVLLCIVLYSVSPQGADDAEFYFFDVGEADCILIKSGDKAALVDTGEHNDSEALSKKLSTLGVEKLDFVVLTHPDKDHIGGAVELLQQFPAAKVYMSPFDKQSDRQRELEEFLDSSDIPVEMPDAPVHLALGELACTIYPPQMEYDDANDASLLVYATHGNATVLLAGDIEEQRINEAMTLPVEYCTLYKVAHHGRENEASAAYIAHLSPLFAVVTADEAEDAVRQALREEGTELFYTGDGDVKATVNGDEITLTQRGLSIGKEETRQRTNT